MTRKRSALGQMQSRAWRRDWEELKARDAARLPPMPDPDRQPREYVEWMQKNAQRELSPEWQRLFDDMRKLPQLNFSRKRDREIWAWVYLLLVRQHEGAPYDLRTCKLGANPANPNAQPSKMLRYLVATVAQEHPNVDAGRLYDAIRNWRRSVSTI